MPNAEGIAHSIWSVPKKPLARGAWLWWFWLFFIHDENTEKTGRCRQLMILWSVKNDPDISCNGLQIRVPKSITAENGKLTLDGAAAAWYFDGEKMHENIVLETSKMSLDPDLKSLRAPGKTPSSFAMDEATGEYITKICCKGVDFEFRAKKIDNHPAAGPTYGRTHLVGPMEIEGTRLEILELSGTEKTSSAPGTGKTSGTPPENAREAKKSSPGKISQIKGTAYFQKILLAAPPPQWYWGLYHFQDGSFATYMQVYQGRSFLAGNLYGNPSLKKPFLSLKEDILVYHKPSGRVFEGNRLSVHPKSIGNSLWRHSFSGGGNDFKIEGEAEGYSHSCWAFVKNIGSLPIKSTFKYNEYPAVMKELRIKLNGGEELLFKNGWGNMENSWGFMI